MAHAERHTDSEGVARGRCGLDEDKEPNDAKGERRDEVDRCECEGGCSAQRCGESMAPPAAQFGDGARRGVEAPDDGALRHTVEERASQGAAGVSGGCVFGAGGPDADAANPSGIGFEDFESESVLVADDFAGLGYSLREGEDQPADGVDLLVAFGGQEVDGEALFEGFDGQASGGVEGAIGAFREDGWGAAVMLVLDFADDFLDEVFDGDEAVHAAMFIHDERHVTFGGAHFEQQRVDGF